MSSNIKGKTPAKEAPTEPFKRAVAGCLQRQLTGRSSSLAHGLGRAAAAFVLGGSDLAIDRPRDARRAQRGHVHAHRFVRRDMRAAPQVRGHGIGICDVERVDRHGRRQLYQKFFGVAATRHVIRARTRARKLTGRYWTGPARSTR